MRNRVLEARVTRSDGDIDFALASSLGSRKLQNKSVAVWNTDYAARVIVRRLNNRGVLLKTCLARQSFIVKRCAEPAYSRLPAPHPSVASGVDGIGVAAGLDVDRHANRPAKSGPTMIQPARMD